MHISYSAFVCLVLSAAASAHQPRVIKLSSSQATDLVIRRDSDANKYVYYEAGTTPEYPSPTLVMERCNSYQVSLTNELSGTNSNTNLHTHGLHISGDSNTDGTSGDDVWNVDIAPGATHTYIYNIPCNHATGTHWYHPHGHGNHADQLAGGAAGAIIVQDADNKEHVPDMYRSMREYVFLVQGSQVNGMTNPNIQVKNNEWVRFRIIHTNAGSGDTAENWLLADDGHCDMYLLSKDGVYVAGVLPRPVNSFFVGTIASRADIIVRCDGLGSNDGSHPIDSSLATIQVVDEACATDGSEYCSTEDPVPFTPCRPFYLQDLQVASVDQTETISMSATAVGVNGTRYSYNTDGTGYPTLPGGKVIELKDVSGLSPHPMHVHVNHFQIQTLLRLPQDTSGSWHKKGDWLDTVSSGNGNGGPSFRLRTDSFSGKMVAHCHVGAHSDNGGIIYWTIQSGVGADTLVPDTDFYRENGEVCAATSSTSLFLASPHTPAQVPEAGKLVKLTSETYTVTAELGDSSESQQRLLVRRSKNAKGRAKSGKADENEGRGEKKLFDLQQKVHTALEVHLVRDCPPVGGAVVQVKIDAFEIERKTVTCEFHMVVLYRQEVPVTDSEEIVNDEIKTCIEQEMKDKVWASDIAQHIDVCSVRFTHEDGVELSGFVDNCGN